MNKYKFKLFFICFSGLLLIQKTMAQEISLIGIKTGSEQDKKGVPAEVIGAIVPPYEVKLEDLKIDLPVERFVLKNGLTVLLVEDHSVPLIAYHTWYKVGSRHEKKGVTGAAHMLEHMMFKGAHKYDGKAFDQILHKNGITNNAFTTYDYTGFYQVLPSDKLELMMDMEVDRMSSLKISSEDLKSELQVVGEERRWRYDNQPMGVMREALMGEVYKGSSYEWPVIGYMKDIQAYTSPKLRFFYEKFYIPNNAVLVMVGDFNKDHARSLVEKYYGSLPSKKIPQDTFAIRKKHKSVSKVIYENIQSPHYILSFATVPAGHPDSYALDLAAEILGGNDSSRIYKKFVYDNQQAVGAYAYHYGLAKDGIFALGLSLRPDILLESVKPLLFQEVQLLRERMVSERELSKAKNILMKAYVDSLRTMDGKARALATNEILFGSYKFLLMDLEKYQKVTSMDIQRVAEKYLNMTSRIEVTMHPLKSKPQKMSGKESNK